MFQGISKVVVGVQDQDRARGFWVDVMGCEVVQDEDYGEERWLEVRTPDRAVVLVLEVRDGPAPDAQSALPTAPVFLYCDDLEDTYAELLGRGARFPQPPVRQPFGWWSMLEDPEGNRFALVPRGQ